MNKPKASARRVGELLERCLSQTLARQGFASTELVTRWPEIVGAEIAAHAEPLKISWPRGPHAEATTPATLLLRVEGPSAIEIQHLSGVILERVNRFFGWRAVGKVALRQAPLARRPPPAVVAAPSAEATAQIAATLTAIADEDLRAALARLGAAVAGKRRRAG
ncbi:MAG TPA: DciA family protein [Xanthobacteraceae bacterium]|nr:DciA family protein [Xanthobacteraceae bacterium]